MLEIIIFSYSRFFNIEGLLHEARQSSSNNFCKRLPRFSWMCKYAHSCFTNYWSYTSGLDMNGSVALNWRRN